LLGRGKEHFPQMFCRSCDLCHLSLLFHLAVELELSSMEREISRVKRARLLSKNQIREIVMD